MPRIDNVAVQEKFFKKKEYRSWDVNLLEKLKLNKSEEKLEKKSRKDKKNEVKQTNANRVQLGFNQSSTEVQSEFNKGSNRVQIEFNKGSTKVQLNPNNRVQLEFIENRNLIQKLISKLSGNEKKVFFYVINICSVKGSLSTGEILGEELTNAISTTRNGRETAIKRLSKKGLLKRKKGKTGKNSTICLYVNELIKSEAIKHLDLFESEKDLLLDWGSIRVQKDRENRVQLGFKSDIYSSSNYNNTTTKGKELPETWLNINIEPLKHIGFSVNQLKQLYRLKIIEPEVIQESIYHFAYGLKYKKKNFKSDPLNVFIGVLRKGEVWIEEGYKSPQSLAQGKLLEQMKKEKEQLKNLQDQSYKLALEDWKEALDKRKKGEILRSKQAGSINLPESVSLNIYFREHVWPAKKKDYLVAV